MKKNLLKAILLTLTAAVLLSGCSLFATPSGDSGNGGSGGSTGAVKMTDSYTFEDPANLDFDTRYVIHCDQASAYVANMDASFGIMGIYTIVYAKDDAPVASYEFYICDSEEHAQATADTMAAFSGAAMTAAEGDPCVRYSSADEDAIEASLLMLQSYGMISETTASAYVEYTQTSTGGKLVE